MAIPIKSQQEYKFFNNQRVDPSSSTFFFFPTTLFAAYSRRGGRPLSGPPCPPVSTLQASSTSSIFRYGLRGERI